MVCFVDELYPFMKRASSQGERSFRFSVDSVDEGDVAAEDELYPKLYDKLSGSGGDAINDDLTTSL